MERKYGRHIRSRISQPTIYPLEMVMHYWQLDRAFGPHLVFLKSGNRHNRLAAIRRAQQS